MPIPESASFLVKKPTVPPTFDGVDYNDQVALKKAQDAVIREQWVRSMMARLVRDEMGRCYRREGVNHLEKCGKLRGELPLFRLSELLVFSFPSPCECACKGWNAQARTHERWCGRGLGVARELRVFVLCCAVLC